jgi:pimeloyl-ACP methyl ester carboxylesterase
MVRILGAFLAVLIALLILFLLGSTFLISSDLIRSDLYEKYRNEKSFLYRIESGATVHIRDEGNRAGPPMVLLHGAYASVHAWEPWVEELGDEFRLISFDLPGHGLTGAIPDADYSRENMSRTLDQIMQLMKLDRAVIVGHSMGGSVVLQYALDHPEKIRGLVLIGSSGMRRTTDENIPSSFGIADVSWLNPHHALCDAALYD